MQKKYSYLLKSKNYFLYVIDQDTFLHGRVFGEIDSHVSVHIDDGIITGSVHLPDETYHIEVNITNSIKLIKMIIAFTDMVVFHSYNLLCKLIVLTFSCLGQDIKSK